MDQDQPNIETKIVNESNMNNPTASMLLDMKNYMIAQQAHNDKLQRQQMDQNARPENQMQLTNSLMNQMLEMNLNIRNESMLQNTRSEDGLAKGIKMECTQ
jgi:hypothetical protein